MIANVLKRAGYPLVIEGFCLPFDDKRYPTDISLVNEDREKTGQTIDTLFEVLESTLPKPRPLLSL